MPTIQAGAAYNIALKANQNLVFDVYHNIMDSGGIICLYNKGSNYLNQQYFFFALDGGRYAIVPRSSGKPVEPIFSDIRRIKPLQQRSWGGTNRQQWYLLDAPGSSVEIFNQDYGQVASYGKDQELEYPDLDTSNPSDPNRTWYLQPVYQATLPQLVATKPIGSPPQYAGDPYQVLPDQSEVTNVSNALIPCILVNDGSLSDATKVQQSPYYLMIKQQFWQKAAFGTVAPNSKRSFSFKTGSTSIDQKSMSDTLSITVGGDLGLQFKGASASAKFEISRQIQTVVSSTNEQMSEYTDTIEFDNSSGTTLKGISIYQLVTRYALYRTNGSAVSDPWKFIDNKSAVMVVS
ncbi:toxin [Bacillus cereus]|uniref:toxin n=1 Tax=Bacillus cereus TaxID=1396 RepID=UPI0009AB0424|nr:toxin [Bacillus cereus]PEA01791.1 toxin [Bacillus cereus]